MARKLSQEEIVTLKTLHEKGESTVEIGRTLGASEGAVRNHLRRAAVPGRQRIRISVLTRAAPNNIFCISKFGIPKCDASEKDG